MISDRIKVVHVIYSLAEHTGGPAGAVAELTQHLAKYGCNVDLCTSTAGPEQERQVEIDRSLVNVHEVRNFIWRRGRISWLPGFRSLLHRVGRNADLIHSHGLWTQASRAASGTANKLVIPNIISLRGMLRPAGLSHHGWKKKLGLALFGNRMLRRAGCLDCKSVVEAEDVRALIPERPISVTPIGLDTSRYHVEPERGAVEDNWPDLAGKRIILSVCRIHPIKRLTTLARAWGGLYREFPDWHLVIAGPDEGGHRKEIEQVVRDHGAWEATTFTGPVRGEKKIALYSACDLFVLPSVTENFGVVVAEALASGKPVVTTVGTPWVELDEFDCGWRIELGREPMETRLREAMVLPDETRREMGLRGRRLVKERFDWEAIAKQTVAVYNWVLRRGPKPDCVMLDESIGCDSIRE